jgi:hypothetical protein
MSGANRRITLIRRHIDSRLFRPSYPSAWTDVDAFVSVVNTPCGFGDFYFRGVRPIFRRFWFDYWLDTGEIWAFGCRAGLGPFDIVARNATPFRGLDRLAERSGWVTGPESQSESQA